MSHKNSGFIGVDKRFLKSGVYGLRKHRQERSLGNFKSVVHSSGGGLTDELAYPGGLWTNSNFKVSVQPLFHFDGSILDGVSADNNPSNGTAVSTWGDRSGQSTDYDATQSTASSQPTFQGTYLDFDGSNDNLALANTYNNANGSGWTLCFVAYKDGTTNFGPIGKNLANSTYVSPLNYTTGTTYFLDVSNASVSESGYGPHFNSIQQFVTQKDTSDVVTYYLQGGNSYKSFTYSSAITNLFSHLGHNGYYHNGRIYELIVWNSTLSTADLNVVRTYFNNKYTSLPSSTAFS